MAESKLETIHQIFVITQLAMFERPKTVQTRLKEIYEVEISLPAILHYDISNSDLLKKWKTLFNKTRKKFLEDSAKIPIANKSYRLQKLQNMFEKEEIATKQNTVAMRDILEQAAKESGDVFTNKSQVRLSDPKGEPLKITVNVVKSDSIVKDESDD